MMKRLVVTLFLAAGCVSYEPNPVDWNMETKRMEESPREIALSVAEARVRGVAFSPDLNGLRLQLAVAEEKAKASGWWEDPSLDADFLRILKNPSESAAHPNIMGLGISFTLPLSGIPSLETKAAEAYARADRWSVIAAERAKAGEIGSLSVTSALLAKEIASLEHTLEGTNYVASLATVGRMADIGELPHSTERTLLREQNELLDTLVEFRHELHAAESSLRRELALAPDCKIVWTDADSEIILPTNNYAAIDFTHAPAVRSAMEKLSGGEHELDIEIRKQYPELSLGPAYSREEGFNRVGLKASLTLPLWNRNRVGIATAKGARETARLDAVETWRESVYTWQTLKLEAEHLHGGDGREKRICAQGDDIDHLLAVGELAPEDYVGIVHQRLNAEVTTVRRKIETGVLAEKMKAIIEGLEVKE